MQSHFNENNTSTHFRASTEANQIAQLVIENNFPAFQYQYIELGARFDEDQWGNILNYLEKWRIKDNLTIFHIAAGNNGIAFLNWFKEKGLESNNSEADITLVVFNEIHNYQLNPSNLANYLENITAACILDSKNEKTYTHAVKEIGTYGINLLADNFPKISANYGFDISKTKIIENLFYLLHVLIEGSKIIDVNINVNSFAKLNLTAIQKFLYSARTEGLTADILTALNNIIYENNNKILPTLLKRGFTQHAGALIDYGVSPDAFYEDGGNKQSCFQLAVSQQTRELTFQVINEITPEKIIKQHVFKLNYKKQVQDENRQILNHDEYNNIHTLFKQEKTYAYWVGFYFYNLADYQGSKLHQQSAKIHALFYLLLADPINNQSVRTLIISCLAALRLQCKTTSDLMPNYTSYESSTLLQEFDFFIQSGLATEFLSIVDTESKRYALSSSLFGKMFFSLGKYELAKKYLNPSLVDPSFFHYVDAEACHATGMLYLQNPILDTDIEMAGQYLYQAAASNHQPSMPQLTHMLESTDVRIQQAAQSALAKTHLVFASQTDTLDDREKHINNSILFIKNNVALEECVKLVGKLKYHQATISFNLYNYALFGHQQNNNKSSKIIISKKDIALTLPLLPILLRDKDLERITIKDIEAFYLPDPLLRSEAFKILLSHYESKKVLEKEKIVKLFCSFIAKFRAAVVGQDNIFSEINALFSNIRDKEASQSFVKNLASTMLGALYAHSPLNQSTLSNINSIQIDCDILLDYLSEKEIQDFIILVIDHGLGYLNQNANEKILSAIKKLAISKNLEEDKILALIRIFNLSKLAIDENIFKDFINDSQAFTHVTSDFVLNCLANHPELYFNLPYAKQKTIKIFTLATQALFSLYKENSSIDAGPIKKLIMIADKTADGFANFLLACNLLQHNTSPFLALSELEKSKLSGFPLAATLLSLCASDDGNKFAKYEEAWKKKPNQSNLQRAYDILESGLYVSSEAKQLKEKLSQLSDNNPVSLVKACIKFIAYSNLKENDTTTQKVAFIIYKLIVQNQPALQLTNPFDEEIHFNSTTQAIVTLSSQTNSLLFTNPSNNNNAENTITTTELFELYKAAFTQQDDQEDTLLKISININNGLANFLYACYLLQNPQLFHIAEPYLTAAKELGFSLASPVLDFYNLGSHQSKFSDLTKIWLRNFAETSLKQRSKFIVEAGALGSFKNKELRQKLTNTDDNYLALLLMYIEHAIAFDLKENDETLNKIAFIIFQLSLEQSKLSHTKHQSNSSDSSVYTTDSLADLSDEEYGVTPAKQIHTVIPSTTTSSILDNSSESDTDEYQNIGLDSEESELENQPNKENASNNNNNESTKKKNADNSFSLPSISSILPFFNKKDNGQKVSQPMSDDTGAKSEEQPDSSEEQKSSNYSPEHWKPQKSNINYTQAKSELEDSINNNL